MAYVRQSSWHVPDLSPPPEEPQTPNDAVLARYAIQLALHPAAWVRRRVETFEFLDAETVRRRMSVSFEVPEEQTQSDAVRLERDQEVYVPVMLLLKQSFRNFDVIDEQGNSLVVPTSERNSKLAVLGVVHALESVATTSTDGLEDEIERIVAVKAESSRTAAAEAKQSLAAAVTFVNGERFKELTRWMQFEDERARLRSLITYLGGGFMLLVRLPYAPGARRLVKFSYDVTHRDPKTPELSRRIWRRTNRIMSSCGLMARFEVLDGLGIGLAESYHAEAVPPAETVIAEALLEVTPASADRDYPDRRIVATDNHRMRPHVYMRGAKPGDRGKLYLLIYTQRESLLVPLWLAAALISSVLICVPKNAEKLDGQTLSALLLVPFALAAFYIRNPENRYVTSMLRGVRVVAGIPVAAGAVVIAMLGLGYLKPVDGQVPAGALDLACGAAYASSVATVVLALALLAPWVGSRYRRALAGCLRRRRGGEHDMPAVSIFRFRSVKFSPPATVENMGVAPDPAREDPAAESMGAGEREHVLDA